jgi:hypothetical protein
VVAKPVFILHIRLLHRFERHPSVENPNHSHHALIGVLCRMEKWKNRYNMAKRPNSELGSFSPRIMEIPSEGCSFISRFTWLDSFLPVLLSPHTYLFDLI